MKKYYRCWAFYWDDQERQIIVDDGFEFFLPELGLLESIKDRAEHVFASLASELSGLVLYDATTDKAILGIIRNFDAPDTFFGVDIVEGDEVLFFGIAEKILSASDVERERMFTLLTHPVSDVLPS